MPISAARLSNLVDKISHTVDVKSKVYGVYAGKIPHPIFEPGARGTAQIYTRLDKVPVGLLKAAKVGLLEVGFDIFKESMDQVPVDTGKLANSGTLSIGNTVYAKGTCQVTRKYIENLKEEKTLSCVTGIQVLRDRYKDLLNISSQDAIDVKSGQCNLFISFYRAPDPEDALEGMENDNIALYAHEYIGEHGSGQKPQARLRGRGGPFIAGPMESHASEFRGAVENSIMMALKTMKLDRL